MTLGPAPTAEEKTARKLVTVRKIAWVKHLGKNHNVVTIGGWKVVVNKKKLFRFGEDVLFCEIDSFLPASNEVFAKLPNLANCKGTKGYHVITVMTRGQASQGMIFHLDDFPTIKALHEENMKLQTTDYNFSAGAKYWEKHIASPADHNLVDYSAELGVTKFWDHFDNNGPFLGPFPSFIQKTDMERIQNCPNLFTSPKYRHQKFQETVKMDGATMTVYFINKTSELYKSLPELPEGKNPGTCEKGRVGVCSRTREIKYEPSSLHWQIVRHYVLRDKLNKFGKNIAVQGELTGSSINGNHHEYPEGQHEFLIFAIFDIDTQERWNPMRVEKWVEDFQLEHVPRRGYKTLYNIPGQNYEGALLWANQAIFGEGLVYKNVEDNRWFKVISESWLARHGL